MTAEEDIIDTTPPSQVEPEPEDTSPEPQEGDTEPQEQQEPEQQPEDDEAAKRLARMAHEAREAKKMARQLKAELDALKGNRPPPPPDEEMERKIEERAKIRAQEQAFADMCNSVYHAGAKAYGKADWDDTIKALSDQTGTVIPPVIVEAAHDAGEAHRILKYFSENPDEYDDVLQLPIHRMGAKVARIASKLESQQQAQRQVSKAPPPIKTVTGSTKAEPNLEDMPMEEFMKLRDKQELQRRGRL